LLASFPIIKMQEDVLLFDRLFVGDLIIQSPNPFLGSLSLSRWKYILIRSYNPVPKTPSPSNVDSRVERKLFYTIWIESYNITFRFHIPTNRTLRWEWSYSFSWGIPTIDTNNAFGRCRFQPFFKVLGHSFDLFIQPNSSLFC
jgi:hypothetical protein